MSVRSNRFKPALLSFIAVVAFNLTVTGVLSAAEESGKTVHLYFDESVPQVEFAAHEIERAFKEKGHAVVIHSRDDFTMDTSIDSILLTFRSQIPQRFRDPEAIPSQGFRVRTETDAGNTGVIVIGDDPAGVMYGGFHVAEQIRFGTNLAEIAEIERAPAIQRRGIKFNIPLDARTPSYDDTGDAAQNNYAEMWNFDFWRGFLDNMARYRYNTLTLWNPHPFPSLVKLPDYPDCVLEDVCVTTLEPTYESGAWRDPQFVSPKVLENLKVVKKMSMDEKIDFWRRVMRYAKERNIDIYFITWNVIVNSAEGKYGITAEQDNPKTIAYMRECVRQLILTYPDLTGIGVTAGEHMQNQAGEWTREEWLWQTYGLGVLDAKKEQPDRTVRFIHRVWNTDIANIADKWVERYPDPFELGFKYARAHMYSSTKPPYANQLVEDLNENELKCWWNLRNDDIFNFRWGDPDYAREFLQNLPPDEVTAGYHMGSDGYVWGREFTSLEPTSPRQLEIEKHWYKFLLWGRLGYEPQLDREFFEDYIHWKLPQADPGTVYDAWAEASKIIPLVNRFHWRNWDFMWAVEGCMDQRNGFHTVRDFIDNPPMEGTELISIREFVTALTVGGDISEKVTPPEVAEQLDQHAKAALDGVGEIRKAVEEPSRQLDATLKDIAAMAHLGRYYANKIRGAGSLAFYDQTGNEQLKKVAVLQLEEAAKAWREYAEVASSQYKPQLLARTRTLDWKAATADVEKDVEIAENAKPKNTEK